MGSPCIVPFESHNKSWGVGPVIAPICRGGGSLPGSRAQDHQAVEAELRLKSADWKIVITSSTFSPCTNGAAPLRAP